jgi:hypothetical protein
VVLLALRRGCRSRGSRKIGGGVARAWNGLFASEDGGLRVVESRLVEDPWEAGRLLNPTFPGIGDSVLMTAIGGTPPSETLPMGGRWAGTQDTLTTAWFPLYGAFPEIALLDVVIRNTSPQSAVIRRISIRADALRPRVDGILCQPMNMAAVYHIALDGSKQSQVMSAPLAHRIAGNDAERLGLLIAHRGHNGTVYRLRPTLIYNEGAELDLPPVEVELWKGCGRLGHQIDQVIELPPS